MKKWWLERKKDAKTAELSKRKKNVALCSMGTISFLGDQIKNATKQS